MNLVLGCVVTVGGVTAGAQIARGAFQAIHKVAEGKHAEGFWKLAGGVIAPVNAACRELWSLGTEAVAAAEALHGKVKGRMGRTRVSNSAGEAKA